MKDALLAHSPPRSTTPPTTRKGRPDKHLPSDRFYLHTLPHVHTVACISSPPFLYEDVVRRIDSANFSDERSNATLVALLLRTVDRAPIGRDHTRNRYRLPLQLFFGNDGGILEVSGWTQVLSNILRIELRPLPHATPPSLDDNVDDDDEEEGADLVEPHLLFYSCAGATATVRARGPSRGARRFTLATVRRRDGDGELRAAAIGWSKEPRTMVYHVRTLLTEQSG